MSTGTYLISDLHLDHRNIIDYCDRPFTSLEEMNETLVSNWNQQVAEDAQVIFGGDLTIPWTGTRPVEWLDRLNGDVVFVRGNHDDPEVVTTRHHHRFECSGCRFHCVHRPEETPDQWPGWVIYGHHHNNDPGEFPFLDPVQRRINVSVELIDYRPLALETLVTLMDRGERLEQLPSDVKR